MLCPEGVHALSQMRAGLRGEAMVMAVEVSRPACEDMRAGLRRFVKHPAAPARNFGFMVAPDAYGGGGCLSFALHMLRLAGLWREVAPHVERMVPVHAGVIGQGAPVAGVRPYRRRCRTAARRLSRCRRCSSGRGAAARW